MTNKKLLQLDKLAILDLVHGEADADGIALVVKIDSAQRGVDFFGLQRLLQGRQIGRPGLFDGVTIARAAV